jgi:hypothetical protein
MSAVETCGCAFSPGTYPFLSEGLDTVAGAPGLSLPDRREFGMAILRHRTAFSFM